MKQANHAPPRDWLKVSGGKKKPKPTKPTKKGGTKMNQEQVAKVLEAVRRKLDPAAQEKARNALAWAYRIGHRDEGNRAERRAFAAEKRGKGLHGWRQRHQRVGQKYPTAQFLPTGEPCTCPREAIALCRCGWPS